MRRSFVLLPVLVLWALMLWSCGGEEKELASINPGLYESSFNLKFAGQLLVVKQRVRYMPDGLFMATNFQNDIAFEELKGKYRIENGFLVSYEVFQRLIVPEGDWKKREGASVRIRRITKNSYQYYFEFPDEMTRERFKGIGLTEGWKTVKRIGD